MSLSKYFEKSDAFQPEDIVKEADRAKGRWTPSAQQEQKPFVAEKVTAKVGKPPRPLAEQTNGETVLEEDSPPETTPETAPPTAKAQATEKAAAKPKPPPAPPQTPKPVIDPEKYMDRQEAEKAIEDAYQRGCNDGRHKLEQDFQDAVSMLITASQQIDTIRETLIGNSAGELQEFALAIAEKILRISIAEQDQTLIATIEEALHRAVKSEEFTVYVNPEDYELATERAPAIVTGISGLNNLVIKKDATIERGGAKLESDNCTIDASVLSQLDVIREVVRKRLS